MRSCGSSLNVSKKPAVAEIGKLIAPAKPSCTLEYTRRFMNGCPCRQLWLAYTNPGSIYQRVHVYLTWPLRKLYSKWNTSKTNLCFITSLLRTDLFGIYTHPCTNIRIQIYWDRLNCVFKQSAINWPQLDLPRLIPLYSITIIVSVVTKVCSFGNKSHLKQTLSTMRQWNDKEM